MLDSVDVKTKSGKESSNLAVDCYVLSMLYRYLLERGVMQREYHVTSTRLSRDLNATSAEPIFYQNVCLVAGNAGWSSDAFLGTSSVKS